MPNRSIVISSFSTYYACVCRFIFCSVLISMCYVYKALFCMEFDWFYRDKILILIRNLPKCMKFYFVFIFVLKLTALAQGVNHNHFNKMDFILHRHNSMNIERRSARWKRSWLRPRQINRAKKRQQRLNNRLKVLKCHWIFFFYFTLNWVSKKFQTLSNSQNYPNCNLTTIKSCKRSLNYRLNVIIWPKNASSWN